MLDCVLSATARYRNQVAKGTRETDSGVRLPMSSTIAPRDRAGTAKHTKLRASRWMGGCVTPQRTEESRQIDAPVAAADGKNTLTR
jgi:hypothetical protein